MSRFLRLVWIEIIKLRRSSALRMVWLLPLLFVALDFLASQLPRPLPTDLRQWLAFQPIRSVQVYWAGFFHILLLPLMPGLLFRAEHRAGAWKHLDAMPTSPKAVFLAKGVLVLAMVALPLLLVTLGLRAEWGIRAQLNPALPAFHFPWVAMAKTMGWLFLGSLPLLSLYLWVSERISSGAVPISFALIGLILNISLSGGELDPAWRRDLIPWTLPYACAQQAVPTPGVQQAAHAAGNPFNREIDLNPLVGQEVTYLPSGRKVTTTTTIDPYFLLPPPPTPKWLLATFSLGAGAALLSLGLLAARRNRT